MPAASPISENERLYALRRYGVLDTPAEREYDDIVAVAAQICGVPTALISLVDDQRQWFKAALGVEAAETPRDIAFCAHAIEQAETMVVEDASRDPRFTANPLVTGEMHVRFYAGAQLRTPEGFSLGTLCVLDTTPRSLSDDQRRALEALARQVMTQFELRRLIKQRQVDEQRNHLIIETAVDYAIITTDLNGVIESWNEGAARMFGRRGEDIRDQPCAILFTAEDNAVGVPQAEMANAVTFGRVFDERWHPRADGKRFWGRCEVMPLRNPDGDAIGFLKIMQDRTAQQIAEKNLVESEMRVRLALDAAELGAWEAILGLDQVYGDPRSWELLGAEACAVMSFAAFLERVHPADRSRLNDSIAQAMHAGPESRLDVQYRVNPRAGEPTRWLRSRAQVIKRAGERYRLVGTVRDVSADKAAEAHRQLLNNELQHRVKNTLAVVQGIVSQSLKNVATPAEAREAITSRLSTLAHAHDILTQTSWSAAPIGSVIEGAVLAHCADTSRVAVDGPPVELKAKSALALSMTLHELFTNATKYGALSNDKGVVELSWTVETAEGDDRFDLVWLERGGPIVKVPTRFGFGTRLTGSSLAGDLGGRGVVDYAPGGVRWSLSTTLAAITEASSSI